MNTTEFVTLFTLMIPVILTYIKSLQNENALKDVKVQVNGKIDALIKAVEIKSFAEGKLAGAEASREIAKELLGENQIRVDEKLDDIHSMFNSKMDKMMAIIKEKAFAEGKLAGAEEGRQTAKNLVKTTAQELSEGKHWSEDPTV